MHQFRIVIAAAAITLYLTGFIQGQSIVIPPSHATGKLKETAVFQCQVKFGTFKEMTWEFSDQIIYSFLDDEEEYPLGKTKYSVARKDGDFHLTVHNLTYDDGGAYTCAAFAPTATACLVVLGEPLITIYPPNPAEGDLLMFRCEAHFGGPNKNTLSPGHIPQLTLSVDGLLESPTLDESVNKLIQTYNVTAEASMDGTKVTCEIKTTYPLMSLNISRVVNVFYPVRNIRFSPEYETIEIGSNIECTADGFPQPLLVWKNEDDPGQTINGKWLNITKDMKGKNVWKCLARNIINEDEYEDHIIAEFEAMDQSSSGNVAYVIIGVLLVVLLVSGIVVFKFRETIRDHWRKRGTKDMYKGDCPRNDETGPQETDSLKNHEDERNTQPEEFQVPNTDAKQVLLQENEYQNKMDLNQDQKPQSKKEGALSSRDAKYDQFMIKLEKLNKKEDLDREGEKLLDMLTKHKDKIVGCDRDLSLKLVKKAHRLMGSTHYSKMIEIVTDVGDRVEEKSKCLRDLILQFVSDLKDCVKWSKELTYLLKSMLKQGADPTWISKLDLQNLEKSKRYTAQDRFFSAIIHVLRFKNELFEEIKALVLLFMPDAPSSLDNCRGTALHALVGFEWSSLKDQDMPTELFSQYSEIVSQLKERDPDILDKLDCSGRTPLHTFFQGLELKTTMLKSVIDIVKHLKSEKNIDTKDAEGKCVLHYLAESFPILTSQPNYVIDGNGETAMQLIAEEFPAVYKATSNDENVVLFDLVQEVISDTNTSCQDKDKCTVLHTLAKQFSKDINDYFQFLFFELMKIFSHEKSNVDIQDSEGKTVLHILADKYLQAIPENGATILFKVIKHLTSGYNKNIQDCQDYTVLHKLTGKYALNMPKHWQEEYLQLVKIATDKSNSDVKDNKGNTALHILADTFTHVTSEHDTEIFLGVVKHLISISDCNIRDNERCTVLHRFAKKYSTNMPECCHEIFLEIAKILEPVSDMSNQAPDGSTILHTLASKFSSQASECAISTLHKVIDPMVKNSTNKTHTIRDHDDRTTLHVLVQQYCKDMPVHCQEVFDNLVKLFLDKSDVNLQENNGHTALHILIQKYPQDVSANNTNIFLRVIKDNFSLSKREIQDRQGSTVLHKLVEKYNHQTPEHCKEIFQELVKMLKSESSINLQDKQGHTALHIMTNTIFHCPELGSGLIPIIELLLTKKNVNLADRQFITPYSWILAGLDKFKENPELQDLFSKLKKIFKDKNANRETASKGLEVIQQQEDKGGLEVNETTTACETEQIQV